MTNEEILIYAQLRGLEDPQYIIDLERALDLLESIPDELTKE